MVEDRLITWQLAIYELHREIDKLDQELAFLRAQTEEKTMAKADQDVEKLSGKIEEVGTAAVPRTAIIALIDAMMAKWPNR